MSEKVIWKITCPTCGMNAPQGSPYCDRCGRSLGDAPVVAVSPIAAAPVQTGVPDHLMQRVMNEQQDPIAVRQAYAKAAQILLAGEVVEYIATWNKSMAGLTLDCVVATNMRLMSYKKKMLVRQVMDDCFWRDVRDFQLRAARQGAEITIETIQGWRLVIDSVPETQAWQLYSVGATYNAQLGQNLEDLVARAVQDMQAAAAQPASPGWSQQLPSEQGAALQGPLAGAGRVPATGPLSEASPQPAGTFPSGMSLAGAFQNGPVASPYVQGVMVGPNPSGPMFTSGDPVTALPHPQNGNHDNSELAPLSELDELFSTPQDKGALERLQQPIATAPSPTPTPALVEFDEALFGAQPHQVFVDASSSERPAVIRQPAMQLAQTQGSSNMSRGSASGIGMGNGTYGPVYLQSAPVPAGSEPTLRPVTVVDRSSMAPRQLRSPSVGSFANRPADLPAPSDPTVHVPTDDNQKPARVPDSPMRKLKQLKRMLDGGLITEEDYEAKKTEILSRM